MTTPTPPSLPGAAAATAPAMAAPPPTAPRFMRSAAEQAPPAPPRFALLAFGLAAFAAIFVSGSEPGLALAIAAVGVVAGAALLDVPKSRFTLACLAGAGVLASVPLWRDSGWVATLSLLGAITLASIAVSAAATWREVGVATLAWTTKLVPAPARMLAQQTRHAAGVRWARLGPVLRGAALGVGLLLVFGALFASADARFAEIAEDVLSIDLGIEDVVERGWVFLLVLAAAGSLWLTAGTRRERPPLDAGARLGATEWLIALGALVALFAGFVALQLPILFGGDQLVQLTADLTYAEYARQGFAQMTVAAGLTLAVVAAAAFFGPKGNRGVAALSGLLLLLTLVVLASAMHRLGLYQDAYGSTRVRFSMTALMTWLGAVMGLIVIAGATGRTAMLPRAIVLASAAFAIGTVLVNPDHRIAERNVQRFAQTGQLDAPFLTTLSGDAVPALAALPPAYGACLQASFDARLGAGDPPQSWNLGRARGRAALDPALVEAGARQLDRAATTYLEAACPSP